MRIIGSFLPRRVRSIRGRGAGARRAAGGAGEGRRTWGQKCRRKLGEGRRSRKHGEPRGRRGRRAATSNRGVGANTCCAPASQIVFLAGTSYVTSQTPLACPLLPLRVEDTKRNSCALLAKWRKRPSLIAAISIIRLSLLHARPWHRFLEPTTCGGPRAARCERGEA